MPESYPWTATVETTYPDSVYFHPAIITHVIEALHGRTPIMRHLADRDIRTVLFAIAASGKTEADARQDGENTVKAVLNRFELDWLSVECVHVASNAVLNAEIAGIDHLTGRVRPDADILELRPPQD